MKGLRKTVLLVPLLWVSSAGASSIAIPPELRAIAAKMRSIKTLQVGMRQEKRLEVFDELVKSKGSLAFARPQKLRMDLSGPGGTTLVIDGDAMAMHYKALKKTERFKLSADPRARAVAEHLFLLLAADPEALSEIYDLELLDKRPLRIRLIPKAPALARLIKHVEARFDARGFVGDLVLLEANGDTTRWFFHDPKLNEEIASEHFRLD